MANSRLRNPLHNLTQTAFDLAQYLKEIKQETFIQIATPVLETYSAPTKSWIWSWFYSRSRVQFLRDLINELTKTNEKHESNEVSTETNNDNKIDVNNDHTQPVETAVKTPILNVDDVILDEAQQAEAMNQNDVITIVNKIISVPGSGWEETSFNTNLIRALLKQVPDYDHEIQLSLKEIEALKELLFISLQEHQKIEAKVSEEVDKLIIINSESLEVENKFLDNEKALLQKQEELLISESSIITLENSAIDSDINVAGIEEEKSQKIMELEKLTAELHQLESEKLKCEDEYKALEEEKHKCMEEINAARTKLLLLNPEFDIQKLGNNEIESVMNEAKLVAEAAIKDFLMQKEEIARRNKEMEEIARKRKELAAQARENLAKRQVNHPKPDDMPKPVRFTNTIKRSDLTAQLENTLFSNDQKQKQEADDIKEKRSNDVRDTCSTRSKEMNDEIKGRLLKHLNNDKANEERVKRAEEARSACSIRTKATNDDVKAALLKHFNKDKNGKDTRATEAKEICAARSKAMNESVKTKLLKHFNKDKNEKDSRMEEIQEQCADFSKSKEDIKAALAKKFDFTVDNKKSREIKDLEIKNIKAQVHDEQKENEIKENTVTNTTLSIDTNMNTDSDTAKSTEKENDTQIASAFRSGHPYFLQLLNQLNKNTKFKSQQQSISPNEQELAQVQVQVSQDEKKPEDNNEIKQIYEMSLLQQNTMFKVGESATTQYVNQHANDALKNADVSASVSMANK